MGRLSKSEVFYCCQIANTPRPARQKFDYASLSTARRTSEQPHVPLSTVTFMEMMDVNTEHLECTSDSRSLGASMYHREEMILQ